MSCPDLLTISRGAWTRLKAQCVCVRDNCLCPWKKNIIFIFILDMVKTRLGHSYDMVKKKIEQKMEKKVGFLSRTGHHLWSWSFNALSWFGCCCPPSAHQRSPSVLVSAHWHLSQPISTASSALVLVLADLSLPFAVVLNFFLSSFFNLLLPRDVCEAFHFIN